ncbi:hypothetical protein O181_065128, partial [Austropuccinia psidii MF-1]|nr:hypothetical protein [Austropuccinia psidii MF-1]
ASAIFPDLRLLSIWRLGSLSLAGCKINWPRQPCIPLVLNYSGRIMPPPAGILIMTMLNLPSQPVVNDLQNFSASIFYIKRFISSLTTTSLFSSHCPPTSLDIPIALLDLTFIPGLHLSLDTLHRVTDTDSKKYIFELVCSGMAKTKAFVWQSAEHSTERLELPNYIFLDQAAGRTAVVFHTFSAQAPANFHVAIFESYSVTLDMEGNYRKTMRCKSTFLSRSSSDNRLKLKNVALLYCLLFASCRPTKSGTSHTELVASGKIKFEVAQKAVIQVQQPVKTLCHQGQPDEVTGKLESLYKAVYEVSTKVHKIVQIKEKIVYNNVEVYFSITQRPTLPISARISLRFPRTFRIAALMELPKNEREPDARFPQVGRPQKNLGCGCDRLGLDR